MAESSDETDVPDIRKLLTALAVGARSVKGLPLSNKQDNDSDSSDKEDDGDDEFSFQMAFPEFKSLCLETRSQLASLLSQALENSFDSSNGVLKGEEDLDFHDPELWENAAEACDLLLERVDKYVQNVKEGRVGLEDDHLGSAVKTTGQFARSKAKNGWDLLMNGLVDMEKPQMSYNFGESVQNSRTEPFIPVLHPERPFSKSSTKIELLPGHGLETRTQSEASKPLPRDMVAPKQHYPHPYKEEILSLEYKKSQLEVERDIGPHGRSGTLQNPSLNSMEGVWIDTEKDLIRLVSRIKGEECQDIAVDLEAHSFHSFSGFVCLMQISIRRPAVLDGTLARPVREATVETGFDFLIDTLTLRHVINQHLAPIFANPNIVKVMHGADSDIPWLQRDFGIYVVNLFDTGRAARALPTFHSAGLAYLLRKYAHFEADKKHQLSDWRQRSIPSEMKAYATSDTMYLLDIYDLVRSELEKQTVKSDDICIKTILDASKDVCLIRYDKEPFKPSSYKTLIKSKRGRKKAGVLSGQQDAILRSLFEWRDSIAREEDESYQAVCSNTGLVRIATSCPQNVTSLQGLINPLPELVLKYSSQILRVVRRILADDGKGENSLVDTTNNVDLMKSHTPKPSSKRSGMLSPVLGTEALYKQAGWTTPQSDPPVDANYTSSGEENDMKTDIEINSANTNFQTREYMPHSLEMEKTTYTSESMELTGRGKTVDGLGAARVVLVQGNDSDVHAGSAENEALSAKKCATRIRESMTSGDQNLLGLVKSTAPMDADNDSTMKEIDVPLEETLPEDKTISEIPRSMKEIYRISNRNRRRTKKTQQDYPATEKDKLELEAAEKLLARSGTDGGDYFDISGVNKKQRTKSNANDVVDTKRIDTREEDIALMTDLGWVKNKKEVEELTSEQCSSHEVGDASERRDISKSSNAQKVDGSHKKQGRRESKRGQTAVAFDYSNVGDIGLGGNSMGDNPFFTGAALVGGALNQQQGTGKQERKKSGGANQKRGKRNANTNSSRVTDGSVRSTVYRR